MLVCDFDDRWSVLPNRNLARLAEVGLVGLIGLPARDATLLAQPRYSGSGSSWSAVGRGNPTDARLMSLATVLPRSSIRILVRGPLAARRQACIDVRRSRHPVTSSGRVSVPVSITVGLGSIGASSRAVRMSGLSIVVLRPHLAMLQKRMNCDLVGDQSCGE